MRIEINLSQLTVFSQSAARAAAAAVTRIKSTDGRIFHNAAREV